MLQFFIGFVACLVACLVIIGYSVRHALPSNPLLAFHPEDDEMVCEALCRVTGKPYSVRVKWADFDDWDMGKNPDDAFPYLSAADRAFLIYGISPGHEVRMSDQFSCSCKRLVLNNIK